ncbi:neural cell adhesion molecule [Mytilus galloprovincialis]|uniref:Neural cell adhesion molecule n=2 Tax=Mytilus galloprovincialis TaxID=29158 RepID=A0A8B6FME4_MYTGA|nr:neural cell adhesion molecule [Mytilus galloprovincialis]
MNIFEKLSLILCFYFSITENFTKSADVVMYPVSPAYADLNQPFTLMCKSNVTDLWKSTSIYDETNSNGVPNVLYFDKSVDGTCRISISNSNVYNTSCDLATGEFNVTLLSVERKYHMMYIRCSVKFSDGASKLIENATTVISIKEAPSSKTILITANPTGPINSGETLHVTCSISGGNPLAILTWNCSGTAINKSSEKSAFLDIAFTVGQQDDGIICTCFASHLIASYNATAEKVIKLNVYWNTVVSTIEFNVNRSYHHTVCTCLASQDTIDSYSDSASHMLNVIYPPESHPTIQQAIPGPVDSGRSVSLIYSLSGGNPLAFLTWDCNGITQNLSSSTKTEYIVTFTVNKNFDGRVCTCSATHLIDSYRPNAQHQLAVFYAPGEPKLILGEGFPWFEGNTGTVDCFADVGNPGSVYQWMIGGQTQIQNKSLLQIEPLSKAHNGQEIKCSVNNNYTLRNNITLQPALLKLNVEYFPDIEFDRFPVYVVEGENTTITCNTRGNPLPYTQWYINGLEMGQPQKNQSVLYLTDIDRLDQKRNYTCKATSNSSKYEILTSDKDLSVVVFCEYAIFVDNTSVTKVTVLNGPTFPENLTAILRCQVTGNPLPNVTWFLISNETKQILQRQDQVVESSYIINTTNCLHTGIYECTTENVVNGTKVMNSKPTELKVTCSPRLDNRYKETPATVTTEIGNDLNLTVYIVAYPPPVIRWVFSKTISSTYVTRTVSTYTSDLYISNIRSFDFGVYTMHANNDNGDLFIQVSVSEKATPTAPVHMNIFCKTNSLHVSWVSEFNGGREQTFFVEYWISLQKRNITRSRPVMDLGESTTLNFVFNGLLPETNYSVRILASNAKGISVSETSKCITDFDIKTNSIKQEGNNGSVHAGIAMLSVGGILIIVISLVFLIRKKHWIIGFKRQAKQSVNNSNDNTFNQHNNGSFELNLQNEVEETITGRHLQIDASETDKVNNVFGNRVRDNDARGQKYEEMTLQQTENVVGDQTDSTRQIYDVPRRAYENTDLKENGMLKNLLFEEDLSNSKQKSEYVNVKPAE